MHLWSTSPRWGTPGWCRGIRGLYGDFATNFCPCGGGNVFFAFYRSVGFEENIKYAKNVIASAMRVMRWHCSFHFRNVTNKIVLWYFASLFHQKQRSLICLQFCKYFLWVYAIEVNSLAVSSKRNERFEGKLLQIFAEVNKSVYAASMSATTVLKLAVAVWSGFYIKINLPTFFFLCTKHCANNVNFVQNNDHTLQNNVKFGQRMMTTLHEYNVHTSYEQRQLCRNNINFEGQRQPLLYEQCSHSVRTGNVNLVQTTSTLQGQRQLCTNNAVHTLSEQRPHLSEQHQIHYEETRNYRLTWAAFGYSKWRITLITELPVVKLCWSSR